MSYDDTAGDTSESADDAGSDESREQGVELGSLADELEEHSYPTTTSELIEEYGDHEIDMPNGSQSLDEVLGTLEGEDQEYDSADEVRQMIFNMVGSEAVGREGYSDRGGIASDSSTGSEEAHGDAGEDQGESI